MLRNKNESQNQLKILYSFSKILNISLVLIYLNSIFQISQSAAYTAPQPLLTYQPIYIETGIQTCIKGITTDLSPSTLEYKSSYTVLLQRLNNILFKTYFVNLGMNSMDVEFKNDTSPATVNYQISSSSLNPTNFTLLIVITDQNLLTQMQVVYIAYESTRLKFYQMPWQNQFNYSFVADQKKDFVLPFLFPNVNQTYVQVPSIVRLSFVRISQPNDIWIKATVTQLDPLTLNMSIRCASAYVLWIKVVTLFVDPVYENATFLQSVKVRSFIEMQPISTSTPTSPTLFIDPNYSAFSNNYFLGLNAFTTPDALKYSISNSTFFSLEQTYEYANTDLQISGILIYGYICNSYVFYFQQLAQSCRKCIDNCINCIQQDICITCDLNFNLAPDSKNCTCSFQEVSGICYQFSSNNMLTCKTAINNGGTISCVECSRQNHRVAVNGLCPCNRYYFQNSSMLCQQKCGDGFLFQLQCDDGNNRNGDGCNSLCQIEAGFSCDTTFQPSICRSTLAVSYAISYILNDKKNSQGTMMLSPRESNLPFPIINNNFLPDTYLSEYITFKIITNRNPYTQQSVNFQFLKVVDNQIYLKFTYNYTFEMRDVMITINYGKTNYVNWTQLIFTQLEGINSQLIISKYDQIYDILWIAILIIAILSMIGFVLALFSSKFIGIQSIVSLQLIYYSQFLIQHFIDFPAGFEYLKPLKITTGYNDFLTLTDYIPYQDQQKKLYNQEMKKTFIQNFNTNFIFILIPFILFLISIFIRKQKQQNLSEYLKLLSKTCNNNCMDNNQKMHLLQLQDIQRKYIKRNQILFYLLTQFCLWLMLPMMNGIASEILISNQFLIKLDGKTQIVLERQINCTRKIIAFFSIMIVFFVMVNYFNSLCLNLQSQNKLNQRREQIIYKRIKFIYLFFMGLLIFFANQKQFIFPVAGYALIIQSIYLIIIIKVHPYQNSLRIHSFTLILINILYFLFLIVINLINHYQQFVDQTIITIFGYVITFVCAAIVVLTFLRLYYQYRYGQALQKQIQAQRKRLQQQQKLKIMNEKMKKRKQEYQKNHKKLTKQEYEKMNNQYLFDNQQKEQEQLQLLQWLQGRKWPQQDKDDYYYKKFRYKPLSWLKKNDPQGYQKRLNDMKLQQQQQQELNILNQTKEGNYPISSNGNRLLSNKNKNKFLHEKYNLTISLNNQFQQTNKMNQLQLRSHHKKLRSDMNYAYKMRKNNDYLLMKKEFKVTD